MSFSGLWPAPKNAPTCLGEELPFLPLVAAHRVRGPIAEPRVKQFAFGGGSPKS